MFSTLKPTNTFGFLPSVHQLLAAGIAIASAGLITHLQWTKLAAHDGSQVLDKADYLREEKEIETSISLREKMPSLGFDNLMASWAFLDFVQYFGDDPARAATGYSVTPKFFEVAVDRDPAFLEMYPYMSSTITLFSGNPVKSIELLDQALKTIPEQTRSEAYFLWQAKATDELLFLGKPERARQSYLKAAEWASLSDDEEIQAIAIRSRQTADFLAKNPDSRQAQVASWFNILSSAVDKRTQNLAVSQIQQLGGNVEVIDGKVKVSFPED